MLRSRPAQLRHLSTTVAVLGSISAPFALSSASLAEEAKPEQLPPVTVNVGAESNKPNAKLAAHPDAKKSGTSSSKTVTKKSDSKGEQKSAEGPSDLDGYGTEASATGSGRGLQQVPALGKTGTPLGDLPVSAQIIPKRVLNEQVDTTLLEAVQNASGVNVGGQDSLGYFDHFLIRGLNAQIYSDGFSDGDQLGGVSHSLNGVQRIEVLEGPGSALFGSGPPGGTINLVHYTPSSEFHYGDSLQLGSFRAVYDSFYVTGPTTVQGLDYRVDATVSRADGFRDLASQDYEVRPAFSWHFGDHTVDFALDMRHLDETPDSDGLIYFHGQPITGVSIDAKYSTPFAFALQDFARVTLADKWRVSDLLTVNNRFSYLYRTLDVLRNGDSGNTKVSMVGGNEEVIGRQLRQQDDTDNSFDYQLEPVWKFATGNIGHTLLTGFEYIHQTMATNRSTADLPNITNAFAPVPPEISLSGLTFLCDAKHSCDDDDLLARVRHRPNRRHQATESSRRRAQGLVGHGLDPADHGAGTSQPGHGPAASRRRDGGADRRAGELERRGLVQSTPRRGSLRRRLEKQSYQFQLREHSKRHRRARVGTGIRGRT